MTFNHRLLTIAKEAAGLTQAAIAEHAGVSQSLMSKIENGIEEPTPHFISKAAEITGVPVAFLGQDGGVLPEGLFDIFHKKRATMPMKPLKKANARAQIDRLRVTQLLRSQDVPEVAPFPDLPIEGYSSADEVAGLTRSIWRIPDGPFPHLVRAIEATGTAVLLTDLEHEKLRAMSLPGVNGFSSHIILVNSRLPASAQRFALAHELAHLVMHDGGRWYAEMEREADDFASALLMPAREIAPKLRNVRFRDLGALKVYWRVSLAALIYRAYALQLISERHYRTLNMELNRLPNGRRKEPGEFEVERPELISNVIRKYLEEGYTVAEVANLMMMSDNEMQLKYLCDPGDSRPSLRLIRS